MNCPDCNKGFVTIWPKLERIDYGEKSLVSKRFCSNALCNYNTTKTERAIF